MPISTPASPTGTIAGGPNAATITSGSFTPTGDSILVAAAFYRDPAGSVTFDGFSDTGSWGTWVNVFDNDTEFGSDNVCWVVSYCIVGASPSSGAVSVDYSATLPDRSRLFLIEIDSGFDQTTPIKQQVVDGTASSLSAYTDDFASAPVTGNMLLSFCGGANSFDRSTAADTGWTELEAYSGSNMMANVQYRTGTTSTQFGISWSDTCDNGICGAAIEIQEPASSSSALPLINAYYS